MKPSAKERFEKKFEKRPSTQCWVWTGYCDKHGYGTFFNNHDRVVAHRFAYEMYIGPIPEGKLVGHTCGNRSCVNPNHLQIGASASIRTTQYSKINMDLEYNSVITQAWV